MKTLLFLFALISSLTSLAINATNEQTVQQTVSNQQNVLPQPKPVPFTVHVTRVCKYHAEIDSLPNDMGDNVYPGDYLMVRFKRSDLDSVKSHLKEYRLWIDGICFPNMQPLFINEAEPGLIFRIERDTLYNSPWQLLYSNPSYWSFHREVNVNLGTKTTEYQTGEKSPFTIKLFTSKIWMPWTFYPLFIILLILTVRYGKALLKDTSLYTSNGVTISYSSSQATDPEKGVININDVPYSLSRFQFLVWLIVVFFAILHIWIITDVLTSPTGSILLLLGISGGTFYISKLLDKPSAANAASTPQSITDFMNSHPLSQGLLHDMMSDGNSISLHRLQLILFTVFLASYFVWEVINNLIMPQFDQTMLTLMGISNVTYAGIKTTEQ